MNATRLSVAFVVTVFVAACHPSVEPARRPDSAEPADAAKADAARADAAKAVAAKADAAKADAAKADEAKADEAKADAAKADAAKADAAKTKIALLTLERGACFGRCPMYRVQLFDDGALEFVGERFVAAVGTSTAQLDAAALAKLRARVEGSSFARWKQRYTRPTVTDLPTVQLSWKGKTIVHALGDASAPPELTRLENDVDVLLDTARWITGPGAVDR
jgi:nucleoid-associated protein YgaU